MIMPGSNTRGQFRLVPGELIHKDGKPSDLDGGCARTADLTVMLVERGVGLCDWA